MKLIISPGSLHMNITMYSQQIYLQGAAGVWLCVWMCCDLWPLLIRLPKATMLLCYEHASPLDHLSDWCVSNHSKQTGEQVCDLCVLSWGTRPNWVNTTDTLHYREKCFHRKPESPTQRTDCSQTATAGGLTTGAVGSSPAWLTLTGVWGHAVAMNTALCTMSCTLRRKEDQDQ